MLNQVGWEPWTGYLEKPFSMSKFKNIRTYFVVSAILLTVAFLVVRQLSLQVHGEQLTHQAEQRLSVYQDALLAHIERFKHLPYVLSLDPRISDVLRVTELEPMIQTQVSELLDQISESAGADELFVLDTKGEVILSSNHLDDTSFIGHSYSFRPYFRQAMNGTTGYYYAVGATTGKAGFFISAPILRGGAIVGVVVCKVSLADLQQSWQQSGEQVWLADEKGIVFLAYQPQWHYQALAPLTQEQLQELAETRQYGTSSYPIIPSANEPTAQFKTLELAQEATLVFAQPVPGFPWQLNWLIHAETLWFSVYRTSFMVCGALLVMLLVLVIYLERQHKQQAEKVYLTLLEQSEAHKNAIVEQTDAGLITLNHEFHITFINPKAKTLFGLPAYGLRNLPKPEQLIDLWQPRVQGIVETQGLRADGTRFPCLYSIQQVSSQRLDEYLVTLHDISDLKNAELALLKVNEELELRVEQRTQELKEAQEALLQTKKLVALGRMSAAIAHEINQPLAAMSSFVASSLLLLKKMDTERVVKNLHKIDGLILRLARISSQLRSFAGGQQRTYQPVLVRNIFDYAVELMQERIQREGVEVVVSVAPKLRVVGHTIMLEQIFVNLLNNALDAVVQEDTPTIQIAASELATDQPEVLLSVVDNGHGMDEEQLAHIFDPFFTSKEVGEGLGLGLSISYSMVTDMNGNIEVKSVPGEGSRFELTLPGVVNAPSESHSLAPQQDPIKDQKENQGEPIK